MDEGCGLFFLLCVVVVAVAVFLGMSHDKWQSNGAFEERCRARGGYWLADSIAIRDTLTRCIEQPKPIILISPEKATP